MIAIEVITMLSVFIYAFSCIISFSAGLILGQWIQHRE
jgi:hypothetical protein